MTQQDFKIGDWLVKPDRRQLVDLRSTDSTAITLEPKTMAVLVYLAARKGDVVSMDDIIHQVWGDYPVSDNPVYKCIAKLRKVLGDSSKTSQYIETITKKGYRLVAEVLPVSEIEKSTVTNNPLLLGIKILIPIAVVSTLIFIGLDRLSTKRFEITSQQHISAFPGSHKSATLSPDETQLAFVSNISGVEHIWLLSLDEDKPQQLTFGDQIDSRPRWAPEHNEILFNRDGGIWSMPSQGGEISRVVADGTNPNWAANGSRFVFERQGELWISTADGNKQQKVEGVPTLDLQLAARMPALSPDGLHIAYFSAAVGPLGDIWSIPTQGGIPLRLTFDTSHGGAPVWSNDGKYIIYSSQRGGSKTLWQIPVDGGEPVAILQGTGQADEPVISVSGNKIIFNQVQQRYVLMLSDLSTGVEKELLESWQFLGGPEFSADEKSIAYFKIEPGGFVNIFTLDSSGGTPIKVTLDEKSINALPQWSVDGQSIYFYQVVPGKSFRKISINGGISEPVVEGWDWNVEHGAHVDTKNQNIVYSRLSRGVPVTTRIRHLDSGEEKVFSALLDRPRWSVKGDTLIGGKFESANNPEGNGILLCEVKTEHCQQLTNVGLKPQWSSDESEIYFVRAYPEGQTLWVIDNMGKSKAREIGKMEPISPIGNFYDVNAKNQLVWVRFEQSDSELWQINLAN